MDDDKDKDDDDHRTHRESEESLKILNKKTRLSS